MKTKEFIEVVFIHDIGRMIDCKLHYLSFFLISTGIEFLGACLDNYPFQEPGHSEARFNGAINDSSLFPNSYRSVNSSYDLYHNLRCGLLHASLPKKPLELIQQVEADQMNLNHLDIRVIRRTLRLVLVSEVFYKDFKSACNEIIDKIDKNILTGNKYQRDILIV